MDTLKFRGMRISKPVRGGGALGASANLFDRFARVVKVKEITHKSSVCGFSFYILIVVVIMVRFRYLSYAVIRKCYHKFL